MHFKLKELLLISALQVVCGVAFSQEPLPDPKPKESVEKQEQIIFDVVEEDAQFPEGLVAMRKYIADNLKYPTVAKEAGLEGRCILRFVVGMDGIISNVAVKRGVMDCPECDAEAIRLVKSMPKWIPGKVFGKNVNSFFTLLITFKL